jgi:hypothetical protein
MRKIFCVATDTGFSDNDGSVAAHARSAPESAYVD